MRCRPKVTAAVWRMPGGKTANEREVAWASAAVVGGSSRAALEFDYTISNLGSWRQAEFDNRNNTCCGPTTARIPRSGLPPGVVQFSSYGQAVAAAPHWSPKKSRLQVVAARDSQAANATLVGGLQAYIEDCVHMPPFVTWES